MSLSILRRRLAACTAATLLAACSHGDAATGPRVVCVSKQINEYLYDIHAESALVARDLTSIYPPQITKLPSVGYHRALSAEGIISMRPTMLLTDGNLGPEAVVTQVRKVGIPVVVMTPGNSPDSARSLMTRLGAQFHREKQADSVIAQWNTDMAAALADSTRWMNAPKPRVLIMHMGQIANNYLAIKRGTPGDQIVRWAGGVNAVDSAGGMMRLTPELIAKAAPDIIIATDVGYDRVGSPEKFAELPGVSLTPAGKAKRIYRVDETEVMYYSPRTPATLKKVAGWLHPAGGQQPH
ncbi:MAG TPA: ABC transporter substrate-binding protein [Gemmatimonadaceae bacterium]|nr:ABC transporter substrate-binding protein [Gemmatimonadaceae bacterium]